MTLELDRVKLCVSDWTKVSVGVLTDWNSNTTRTAVSIIWIKLYHLDIIGNVLPALTAYAHSTSHCQFAKEKERDARLLAGNRVIILSLSAKD